MNLREAREFRGLTQMQLSQRTGIQQTIISYQENGLKDLDIDGMIRCENELGGRIEWADPITAVAKDKALQALAALASRYPLISVLELAKKLLIDRRDPKPIQTLQVYARGVQTDDDDESMLPPGVK